MTLRRVIPALLYSNSALRKTKKFSRPKYVGDAINAVRLFNDLGADELIVLDIDASKNESGPNAELVRDLAAECFMPFTYGGGVSSPADAEEIFSLGVEKIAVNHSVMVNASLVRDLARAFGSSSVVVGIDSKRNLFGKDLVYSHRQKKVTGVPVSDYARRITDLGAGEIFLTSVDREGMQNGMDLKLIEEIARNTDIPLVAHGGCCSFTHIKEAFSVGASAVACGSKFVYHGPHNAVLISYLTDDEYYQLNFAKDVDAPRIPNM